MADNIVAGLFGLAPSQIQQQQQAAIQQQAAAYAQQSPFERAAAGMYQGGAGLGQIGAGMLGMVNPEVEAAKQREAALSKVDFQTPEGILTAAKAASERGDTRMSLQLQMLARQRMAEQQTMELQAAKTRKEEMLAEEAPRLRHEEKMAEIAQRAEAARMRSEDTRLSAQMRADALRESNDLKRLLIDQKSNAPAKISVQDQIRMRKSDEAASAASQSRQLLESYQTMLESYAGKVGAGESIYGTGARIASTLGNEAAKQRAADFETLDAWTKELGAKSLQMFGGSDTEKELDIAIRTNPDPNKTMESNKRIIGQKLSAIEVIEKKPDFESEWIAKNGSLGALDKETRKSFSASWRQFQKDNFKPYSPIGTTKPASAGVKPTSIPSLPSGFKPL